MSPTVTHQRNILNGLDGIRKYTVPHRTRVYIIWKIETDITETKCVIHALLNTHTKYVPVFTTNLSFINAELCSKSPSTSWQKLHSRGTFQILAVW